MSTLAVDLAYISSSCAETPDSVAICIGIGELRNGQVCFYGKYPGQGTMGSECKRSTCMVTIIYYQEKEI